jgi:hypothetical protein
MEGDQEKLKKTVGEENFHRKTAKEGSWRSYERFRPA